MAEALSRVGGEAHEAGSIAWRTNASSLFHAWERRLASVTKDRVVRPFEWGLDWIPQNGIAPDARPTRCRRRLGVAQVMADTDAFFTPPPTDGLHADAGAPTAIGPDVSERARRRRTRIEQHRALPVLSGAGRRPEGRPFTRTRGRARARRCSCCRNGTPTPAATSGCAGCWRGTA